MHDDSNLTIIYLIFVIGDINIRGFVSGRAKVKKTDGLPAKMLIFFPNEQRNGRRPGLRPNKGPKDYERRTLFITYSTHFQIFMSKI